MRTEINVLGAILFTAVMVIMVIFLVFQKPEEPKQMIKTPWNVLNEIRLEKLEKRIKDLETKLAKES